MAKKLWLSTLGDFAPGIILLATKKIIAENDYLPTLHKMLNACRAVGMPAGLPSAAQGLSRSVQYAESERRHKNGLIQQSMPPVATAAGIFWPTAIESKAFPQFAETYQQYCERVIAGEIFTVEPPAALPETSMKRASKEQALTELDNLKQLLD